MCYRLGIVFVMMSSLDLSMEGILDSSWPLCYSRLRCASSVIWKTVIPDIARKPRKSNVLSSPSIQEQSTFQGCKEVIGCILPVSHVMTQSRPLKPLTSIYLDSKPSPLFLPFLPTDWPTRKYLNTPSQTPGLHHPRKSLAGDRSPDPRPHSSPIFSIPTDSSPSRPPALL